MSRKSNKFLAVLDNALVEFLPQKAQYEVIKNCIIATNAQPSKIPS